MRRWDEHLVRTPFNVGETAAAASNGDAGPSRPLPAAGPLVAALAGLAGGWLAAGSTGLLAHALRHALTWLALGTALAATWPARRPPLRRLLALAGAVVLALAMTASTLVPVNVMAVALLLAVLAAGQEGLGRRVVLVAAAAVAVLGVWRLAVTSIPWVWFVADGVGRVLGRLAGRVTGEPLWVGATFGGVDFLVAMAALAGGWLACAPPPRLRKAAYATLGILGVHFGYLMVLSSAAWLLSVLPEPPPAPISYMPNPPSTWTWSGALRSVVPWNLPALAAAIQLLVAGAMLRWTPWAESADEAPAPRAESRRWVSLARLIAPAVLAALLPVVTTLTWDRPSLKGKKIVAYEKGFLNWLQPKHGEYGRLSIGMYGMLPIYAESLGARCVVSPELSEEDLRDADALILLFPNKPWAEGQLERIWSFVRRGGTLLVFGEHTIREENGGSRFNEALAPTAMRVRFDSATFEVGGWLQTYEAMAHPTTAGLRDDRNQFGVVIGASVAARWPARPLLVGRWGWGDPGDPGAGAAMMGNHRYDAGEKLGDLILAAEQPLGAGRVIAFGDTSSMTNGITIGAHVFTSRLLGYAAGGSGSPQAAARQVLGVLAALALVALLGWRRIAGNPPDERRAALAALALAASLALCTAVSHRRGEVVPDGRGQSPNNLAYIDTTHVESNSDESWRLDGAMGLMMTLMRNGYLTLGLPELTAKRLKRAGLLVSIAPLREFSEAERKAIHDFVNGGGIFICTVGYDERGPSQRLLAEFGFHIGVRSAGSPPDEPRPLGHFKAPYVNAGGYMAHVRFHAAWPVECTEKDARPIAYGPRNTTVIFLRRVGEGKVVVVGDTCFAMNKNLENEGGQPFEGMRENADFWRWLLAYLRDQPAWLPPNPKAPPPPHGASGATP